jgi:uncharacterized membrane protein YccF (DUF307 family)
VHYPRFPRLFLPATTRILLVVLQPNATTKAFKLSNFSLHPNIKTITYNKEHYPQKNINFVTT